jgi:protein-disulfide isomerase
LVKLGDPVAKTPARTPNSKAQAAQRQQIVSIVVVTVTAAVVFGFLLLLINQTAAPQTTPGKFDQLFKAATDDGLPIVGDSSQKFTILEFSDFGCPFCKEYRSTVDTLIEKLVRPGRVRFIFAPQLFHQNSDVATLAAMCAGTGSDGKFWQMHDALFTIQATQGLAGFNLETLKKTAAAQNVDTAKWLDCISKKDPQKAIVNSYNLFQKLGAQGTPTVMWSKDGGVTWNLFKDRNGVPQNSGGVGIETILQTVEAFEQGKLS